MKINCFNCGKEIDLFTVEPLDSEKRLNCSHCHVKFKIRPKVGKSGFDIIPETQKRVVRTCINCSRQFHADASEPIPVCPNCKNEPELESVEINRYYIVKNSGEKKGPYSLEELGSWINDGLLKENDRVLTPDKNLLKVQAIEELGPYLKGYYTKAKKAESVHVVKSAPTARKIKIRLKPILLIVTIFILSIWLILVIAVKPKIPKPPSKTKIIFENWQQKAGKLNENFDWYFKNAEIEYKLYTETSCHKAKNHFIKAFIKNGKDSKILSHISLALSCIYYYSGDRKLLDTALTLNGVSMEENPALSIAYVAAADIHFKSGKLEDYFTYINKALEIEPNNPLAFLIKGSQILSADKNSKEGRELIQKSLEIDTDLSFGHVILGMSSVKSYHFKNALENFTARLKKCPKDSATLNNRASLYIQLKRYTDAQKELEKAIKIDPENDQARLLLSQLLYRIYGKTDRALEILKRATQENNNLLKTDLIDGHLLLSNILLDKGKPADALKECNEGLKLKPTDFYLKLNKIRAILALKEKERALSLIQDFQIDDTKHPPIIDLFLINLFEKHSMQTELLDSLDKYINREPKLFYPFAQIAISRIKKNDPIEARAVLLDGMNKTAIFSSEDFLPDIRSPILKIDFRKIGKELANGAKKSMNMELIDTAKALLILQGNINEYSSKSRSEAKTLLQRAIQKDKKIFHAYFILAMINFKQNKYKKAEELLKKALEMDINNVPAGIALGMVYRKLKRYDSSKQLLTDVLNDEKMKFLTAFELGQTEQSSGNLAEAKELYLKAFAEQNNYYPVILKYFNLEM